jgi:hypothetical protein
VTIRNAICYRIHCRRVLLAEIYPSISAHLHVAYADENEESDAEMIPAQGRVEVVGIAALPDPEICRIGRVLSKTALAPRLQIRGLKTIGGPTQRSGS